MGWEQAPHRQPPALISTSRVSKPGQWLPSGWGACPCARPGLLHVGATPGETAGPVQVSLEMCRVLWADLPEVAQGRGKHEVLSTEPDVQLGVWRGPAFLGDSCLLSYHPCPL